MPASTHLYESGRRSQIKPVGPFLAYSAFAAAAKSEVRTDDEHQLLGAAQSKNGNEAAAASFHNRRHLLGEELLSPFPGVVLCLSICGLLLLSGSGVEEQLRPGQTMGARVSGACQSKLKRDMRRRPCAPP